MTRTYGLDDRVFEEMEAVGILELGRYHVWALRAYAQRLGISNAPRITGGKVFLLAAIQDRRLGRQEGAEKLLGRTSFLEGRVAALEKQMGLLIRFALLSRDEATTATRVASNYVMADIGKAGYTHDAALQAVTDILAPLRGELRELEKELEGLL